MASSYSVNKKQPPETKEELEKLDKMELVNLVIRLQAHNKQLRNILSKRKFDGYNEICKIDESVAEEIKETSKKRSFDFTKVSKRHVFLKFIYLGWDYLGFAAQEHTNNTIEAQIFDALTKTCLIADRQSTNYHRCGRTDKGVSGAAQVISLDIRSKIHTINSDAKDVDELPYCKMLNRILPENIRFTAWCPVSDNYSSRFNCISRTYKYYFVKGELNIIAMIQAAEYLIGEHDFRNLCKMDVGNGVTKFCRNILSANIDKFMSSSNDEDSETFDVYVLKITGDGFLWHQIRCIMGILLLVGENRETPDVVKHLLNVDEYPQKPQYGQAHYIPLIFQDCQFDSELDWKYDNEELKLILLKLQNIWALHQIKAAQVKGIVNDIKNLGVKMPNVLTSGFGSDVKSNVYKPLLERPVCESLESRISHYVKKQRIVLKEEDGDS